MEEVVGQVAELSGLRLRLLPVVHQVHRQTLHVWIEQILSWELSTISVGLDFLKCIFCMYVCHMLGLSATLLTVISWKQYVNSIFNLSGPGTCLQSNPLYTKYITRLFARHCTDDDVNEKI